MWATLMNCHLFLITLCVASFSDKLEALLYAQQFEICRVDVKASAFESTNKLALAKSLWYNLDRQTVQVIILLYVLCLS